MLTYVGAIFTYLIFECPLNSILLGPFKVQFCLRWGGGGTTDRKYACFQGFTKIYCWQICLNFESTHVNSFYFCVILLNFGVVLRGDRLTANGLSNLSLFILKPFNREANIYVKD